MLSVSPEILLGFVKPKQIFPIIASPPMLWATRSFHYVIWPFSAVLFSICAWFIHRSIGIVLGDMRFPAAVPIGMEVSANE